MKKNLANTLSPPIPTRTVAYFVVFVTGAVATELASHFAIYNYPLTMALNIAILVALPVVGGAFINEHNLLSRTVSASTFFILGVIAILFHQFPTYLLLLALIVCCFGAQDFLHQKPKTILRAIVYTIIVIAITLLFVGLFVISMATLNHYTVNFHRFL